MASARPTLDQSVLIHAEANEIGQIARARVRCAWTNKGVQRKGVIFCITTPFPFVTSSGRARLKRRGFRGTDGHVQTAELAPSAETMGFGKAAPGRTNSAAFLAGTVGQTRGVFQSDDAGVIWKRINNDNHRYGWIGQVVIGDPRVYGRVYIGTNGRGIVYAEPSPTRGGK